VKFGPVTPEFCWHICEQGELIHAALCNAFQFDADAKSLVSIDESALGGLTLGFATHLVCAGFFQAECSSSSIKAHFSGFRHPDTCPKKTMGFIG